MPEPAIEQTVRLFLGQRMDRKGRALSEKLLGASEGEDWVRFLLMPPAHEDQLLLRGYKRAWHGTKLECLTAFLSDGQLLPSYSRALGHDFMDGKPAVYTDKLKETALGYSKWAPLKHDGVYYAPLLEVLVDREQRVQADNTTQWLQKPGSTELLALWMYGRSYLDMHASDQFARSWSPEMELPLPTVTLLDQPLQPSGWSRQICEETDTALRSALPRM